MKQLNVSKCIQLKNLDCSMNNIDRLDVRKLQKLEQLYCFSNGMKVLKLNSNGAGKLKKLDCSYNEIKKLDISKQTVKIINCKNYIQKIYNP